MEPKQDAPLAPMLVGLAASVGFLTGWTRVVSPRAVAALGPETGHWLGLGAGVLLSVVVYTYASRAVGGR